MKHVSKRHAACPLPWLFVGIPLFLNGCADPPAEPGGAATVLATCSSGVLVANLSPGDCVELTGRKSGPFDRCPNVKIEDSVYPYNLMDFAALPWSQIPSVPDYRRTIISVMDLDFRYEERDATPDTRRHLICAQDDASLGVHHGFMGRTIADEAELDSLRLGGLCQFPRSGCLEGLSRQGNGPNDELDCVRFFQPESPGGWEWRCAPNDEPTSGNPRRVPLDRANEIIEQGHKAFVLVRLTVGTDTGTANCGDGMVNDSETCDDSNTTPGDGCSADCAIEAGWECPEADACTETCGDGLVVGDEECDDRNTTPDDGCSPDCGIEDGWECPADGACTEECGDGLVVGSEACDPGDDTGPSCTEFCTLAADLSILNAELSPPIPEGVDGLFSGVTQYILVQPSSAEVSVEAQCEIAGVPCTENFDVSIPSGDPVLVQVTLPSNMAPGDYDFEFWATSGGLTSDPLFPLEVPLQLGSGELKCERWSDGAAGNDEQRWIGLQLQEPNGTPRTDVEFYVYDGTTDSRGWDVRPDWPKRGARGDIVGDPISIPTTSRFLAMAVDRSTSPPTFMAAREFRWNQSPVGLTKGCKPCTRGTGGTCLIIPLN